MLCKGMRCSDLPYEKSSPAFNRMVYGDGGGGRETSRNYHIRAVRRIGSGQVVAGRRDHGLETCIEVDSGPHKWNNQSGAEIWTTGKVVISSVCKQ